MDASYRLTTAHILYHFPDYPLLLQDYIWQEYDSFPLFPVLMKFLRYWQLNLDGKVERVTVASAGLIQPIVFRLPTTYLELK